MADANTAIICPDCEATLNVCRHFDWCPSLERNRLLGAIEHALDLFERGRQYDAEATLRSALQNGRTEVTGG